MLTQDTEALMKKAVRLEMTKINNQELEKLVQEVLDDFAGKVARETLNTREAARLLLLSDRQVRKMVESGELLGAPITDVRPIRIPTLCAVLRIYVKMRHVPRAIRIDFVRQRLRSCNLILRLPMKANDFNAIAAP